MYFRVTVHRRGKARQELKAGLLDTLFTPLMEELTAKEVRQESWRILFTSGFAGQFILRWLSYTVQGMALPTVGLTLLYQLRTKTNLIDKPPGWPSYIKKESRQISQICPQVNPV